MARITIYHNPRCSKSRQTLELIREKGSEPEIIEYLKTPPSRQELARVLSLLGMKPRDLVRKKEVEYKQAGLDNEALSDDEIIDLSLGTLEDPDLNRLLVRPPQPWQGPRERQPFKQEPPDAQTRTLSRGEHGAPSGRSAFRAG